MLVERVSRVDWTTRSDHSDEALCELLEASRSAGIFIDAADLTENFWICALRHPPFTRTVEEKDGYYEVHLELEILPGVCIESTRSAWSPEIATLRTYVDLIA